jgi:hypothetical protein
VSEQRDWDKELAAIDKVMAKAPAQLPAQGGGAVPAGRGAPAPVNVVGRKAAFFTWLRVLLAVLVAAAMTQWPYSYSCGLNLIAYLGAVGGVIAAGLWSGVTSWQRRMGLAHTIALMVTLWGLVLATAQVLPRIGYARHAAQWWCP